MQKTRTTIHLAGQEFRLTGEESEEYIRALADYVNKKIDEMQRTYPGLSTASCTLLASLNISDELFKLRQDYDALDSRISQLREMPHQSAPVKRPFETKQPATTK